MNIRDVLVTAIVFVLLPMCFLHPWKGMLLYSWIGYMNPHHLTWGFAYNIPFAMIIAIPTIAGLFFTRDRLSFIFSPEMFLMFALWIVFVLSTQDAFYPDDAWKQLDKVTKILAAAFLTTLLFQDQQKIRALLWVIVISLGFYGIKGGIFTIVTGGQYQVLGPPDSFLEGNTNIGLALVMVIPLILALREEQTNPTIRKLLVGLLVLSVIACVGTYSRGAVLGLVVSMGLLVLKGKAKAVVLPLIIGGALLGPYMLPEKWFGRMETIKTYEQESSAVSRLRAWEMAYNLAMDRPLLGGGFETFSVATYQRYLSDERLSDAVIGTGAHSIFFQVLGEHGFTGLFLFAALLMTTFSSLRKVIRQTKEIDSLRWIHNYAHMIQLSLVGFTVSGLFLSMCYFDLYYQLIALTVVLRRMCQIQPAAAPDSLAIRRQAFGGDIAPAIS